MTFTKEQKKKLDLLKRKWGSTTVLKKELVRLEEEIKILDEKLKEAKEDLSNFQKLEDQKYYHDNNTIIARLARQGAIADHTRRRESKYKTKTWKDLQEETMRGLGHSGGKRRKTRKKKHKKRKGKFFY